ncbi:hypothetical protein [Streptomyces spirodelae]|uniref:Uncharacterized protein n=1 Tax=Streptomyces spirodelae TaxID=2812904 RepID=A0ABS3WWM5_9ACTN|nr:hypothetical protein [Streptomyces spirodelae]MBO8187523.1 hypothetical protein [Streptomyces spirodelae]
MGDFQGFDLVRVRELAGHLDSVAGSIVPMHRRLSQILEAAAADMAPQKASTSPELQPLVDHPGVPVATGGIPISRTYGIPTGYLPGPRTQGEALAGGPLPGSVDPFLRRTAADILARCDRLEQVRKAAPPSVELDAGALLAADPVNLNAVPKPNAGEQAVSTWWAGLAPAQREQYLYLKPEALQTLRGLPTDVLQRATQLAYFKVVPYKTSSHESSGGGKLSIFFAELGQGFALRTEQMNDGTYRVTMISNAQEGLKLDEKLKLGGAMKFEIGDTWSFKSKAEAEKLQKDLSEAFRLHTAQYLSPAGWLWAKARLPQVLERIGQPKIKTRTVNAEANAAANITGVTPGIKFSSNLSAITSTMDPLRPTETLSREFTVEPSLARGKVLQIEGSKVLGGAIQVVRDKNNPDPNTNITTVRLIQTVEGKLGGSFSGELGDKKAGLSGSYREGGNDTHVVTVNVPISTTPEEQTAARKWLKTPMTSMLSRPAVPSDPPAPTGDLFSRLAHTRGQVSAVSYKGHASELKLGGKLTIEGIPIGLEGTVTGKHDRITDQRYLGAPDPVTGRRTFVPVN